MLRIRLCPINRTSDECITKGDDGKPNISKDVCTGCGICPKEMSF